MSLPSVVHVSSTFEFGAMFHDCLSADPQGNPPFSTFIRSPMNCLSFMHPPPTTLEPRELIALHCSPILHSPLLFLAP